MTHRERMRAFALVGFFAASVCACKDSEPSGPPAIGSAAVWEPIDKNFKGCEGG